jgi:hypothetical protein
MGQLVYNGIEPLTGFAIPMGAVFDNALLAAGALLTLRHVLLVLAAERGRRLDLLKQRYKANTRVPVSVLIPFLEQDQLPALQALVQAIREQTYPTTQVTLHVAVTDETKVAAEAIGSVRLWLLPHYRATVGEATAWLIDRCLTQGSGGMLVFLQPGDMIKPDFLQNIVAKSFDSFVIQGYIGQKHLPQSLLERVITVSQRLSNRVGNAGRYHLGLSCRLMDSGWAARQEVLEMVPYRRGDDTDNLEYTLRLALNNFRVTWAPSVMVYRDESAPMVPYLVGQVAGVFNRVRLLAHYGLPLLTRFFIRLDFGFFEWFLTLLKPPAFLTGTALILMGLLSPWLELRPEVPLGLAAALLSLQLVSLLVARCPFSDLISLLLATPVVYVWGLLALPWATLNAISHSWVRRESRKPPKRYLQETHNRLNEMALVEQMARQVLAQNEEGDEEPLPPRSHKPEPPRELAQTVSLSNGDRQVPCQLKTEIDPTHKTFRMTLQYKTVAFSTATYKLLDQAFYELQSKLMDKGLTILTCGSCGYFYNPLTDNQGGVSGVCLYGKQNGQVDFETDAVTVLSDACSHHAPLSEREAIYRQWSGEATGVKA